ncbi:MAG TPA: hypothetical protein VGD43_24695 [Micromonospora sp.]
MKLTVVGGGSTYTPELVDGLVRLRDRLDVTELALHDVSTDRLAVLAGLSRRTLAAGGHSAVVGTYTDLAAAADSLVNLPEAGWRTGAVAVRRTGAR